MAELRGRRVRHADLGRLVQRTSTAGAHRQHPAGRARGTLRRDAGRTGHGCVIQTRMPPANPGRFNAALGPLPDWLRPLALAVSGPGLLDAVPDQVIVNEYRPGQGISAHVDCLPCFGPRIATLSLGAACVMRFRHPGTGTYVERALEPGSLRVLAGPARTDWRHEIPARKSDVVDGVRRARGRRVSVTFRTIVRPPTVTAPVTPDPAIGPAVRPDGAVADSPPPASPSGDSPSGGTRRRGGRGRRCRRAPRRRRSPASPCARRARRPAG